MGSVPGSGRFPWREKWQPTPVFLPGEYHGLRRLAGYSSEVTKSWTHLNTHTHCLFASQSLVVFLGSKLCIFFLDKLFHVPNIFPISEFTGHVSLTSLPYPFIISHQGAGMFLFIYLWLCWIFIATHELSSFL